MSHTTRIERLLAATWIAALTTGLRIACERDARADLSAHIIAMGAER